MNRLLPWLAISVLGLLLSFSIHALPLVHAQTPTVAQGSTAILIQDGKQHYDAGRFIEAIQALQRAIQTYGESNNRLGQAQALGLSSLAHQKLGQWGAAETAINSSLSLLASISPSQSTSYTLIRAQTLNAQAHLQLAKGNTEAALETWKSAEALYIQAKDPIGSLGSRMNQMQALHSLGLFRRAEKQLDTIRQDILRLPNSPLKVTGLMSLGTIHRQNGELQQSKDLLAQGLQVAQSLGLPELESQVQLNLGTTDRMLINRSQQLNDSATAQQATQSALVHYQTATAIAASPESRLQGQVNQMSLLIDSGRGQDAESLWITIERTLFQQPASRITVYAQLNLATSRMKAEKGRQENRTLEVLNHALQQAESLKDLRAISYALGIQGQWWEEKQSWAKAQSMTQRALQIAQSINAPDLMYRWQWQMGRLRQRQAEESNGYKFVDTEAIAYYTQAVKLLNELRGDLVALNQDAQFSFRDSVEPIYRELIDLLLRTDQPSQASLRQARNLVESLQLAELDNFFRDACAKPAEVSIDTLDKAAAIIYPIILSNRIEIIVKLPGSDALRHISNPYLTETQVNGQIEQFQLALQRRSTSPSQVQQLAKPIYDWLIRPFETDLDSITAHNQSNVKTLVFVLDGALRNISPAVLHDGKRYLVERYAVAVTPGLQLINPRPFAREQFYALVTGATNAPSFQKERLGPLNNVEMELVGIQQQIPNSRKLEDQTFLKQNIQNQIQSTSFSIVHIATHGQFSSNPEQTFILDWNGRINIKDLDSLLRNYKTEANKPRDIELLILSACETAAGDNRAALGLAGIAIRAGARSTLATLFQVNDASTAEFMIQFYRQLTNPKLSKAEALRSTQLAFINEYKDTDYSRPYYWSPFTLVGNWL